MKLLVLLTFLFSNLAFSQQSETVSLPQVQKMIDDSLASKWYEKIGLKGYAQFRYNRLGETNKDLICPSCDRSIGDKQGFFLRRARLVFHGQMSDRVYIYIQPDYASDAINQNYFQIRDAYFDYSLTPSHEWRVRTGISKVPYGFSNLQSSSTRGPFDRDDALNTGVPNERDTGIFLLYGAPETRKRSKELSALKGTGDYGLLAFGAYNGQSLNRREENNDLHRVIRVTYPFRLKSGQFIEASLQAYEGKFFISSADKDYYDARQAASFIFFPQPIGFQIEYNIGRGPEYSNESNSIEVNDLKGGYAQVNYQFNKGNHRYFPYVRYQEYEGGRKSEEAASSKMNEWEIGTEWQPDPALELTAAYAISDRQTQSTATNKIHEKGSLIRLQAQFNY